MKTQITIFLLYVFGLFTLQSCLFSNCNEISLSEEERKWVEFYEKSDTLIFSNNEDVRDIFVLSKKYEDYTTCSKIELGPDVYNYLGITFLETGKPNKRSNKINISLKKDFQHIANNEFIKSFQVFDLRSSFDNPEDTALVTEYIDLQGLKSRIKTYFFKVGDSFSDNTNNKIRSYNWSKKFGLVKYVLKNGQTFHLLINE